MGAASALGEAARLQVLAPLALLRALVCSCSRLPRSDCPQHALASWNCGSLAPLRSLRPRKGGQAALTSKMPARTWGEIMSVPYADVWRAVCTNICSDFTLHTVTAPFPEQGHSSLQLCVSILLARRANHNVTPPAICGPSGSASRNTTHANSRCAARKIKGSERSTQSRNEFGSSTPSHNTRKQTTVQTQSFLHPLWRDKALFYTRHGAPAQVLHIMVGRG